MSTALLLGARGKVAFIGAETERRLKGGFSELKSPHGSVRYVCKRNGAIVSALQIVVAPGMRPTVANVYTDEGARGQGIARTLFEIARTKYPDLQHATEENRTPSGKAWIQSLTRKR